MSIVGYWRLNGNSNDASGNGYNGTDTDITYSQANGKINQGGGFNGISSFIKITVSASLELTTSGTISIWFSPTNTIGSGSGGPHLMRNDNNSGIIYGNSFYVSNTSGMLYFFNDHDAVYCRSNATSWVGGIWYNAIVTSDGTTLKMYVNSVLQTITGNITGLNFMCQGGILVLGVTNVAIPGDYWNGLEDEIKIDNTIWSPANVKNEYSRIKGFF